jgi:hypothetical protein
MAGFFKSKRKLFLVTGIVCILILGGLLLTKLLTTRASYEIGNYTLKVPASWKVTTRENELMFRKDNIPVGGVQILGYEAGQPVSIPNHAETKQQKNIDGLITEAVLYNLDLTQPAAAGDAAVINENHLYLLFAGEKLTYDIHVNTKYCSETELMQIAKSFQPAPKSGVPVYDAKRLIQYKSSYVGDFSNVGNLLQELPYADKRGQLSLQTEKTPYGITVTYEASAEMQAGEAETTLRNNAVIVFALIDNVDQIEFIMRTAGEEKRIEFSRKELQQSFVQDLREYAQDQNQLTILLNSLNLKILVYPSQYALTMSSTPGLRFLAQYQGTADRVQYTATGGKLLTWDIVSGKVGTLGISTELPLPTPVYWSPGEDQGKDEMRSVKITVLGPDGKLAEKQVPIRYDGSMFFTVEPAYDVLIAGEVRPQPNGAKSLDEAVSLAVKRQGKNYAPGEVATEGHLILDTEENEGSITVYTIASFGYFGFENGIFTKTSGSGAIPTVLTFSRNERGEYTLLRYQEPMDGALYTQSVQKMFPQRLWSAVLQEGARYAALVQQQEAQAAAYLKVIGREAKVSAAYVEKKPLNINVEASNKLLAEYTKNDPLLNLFPSWVGSKEILENGVRYIYETSQSKSQDGHDLVLFTKKEEGGKVVLQYQYQIQGTEPQLVSKTEHH